MSRMDDTFAALGHRVAAALASRGRTPGARGSEPGRSALVSAVG